MIDYGWTHMGSLAGFGNHPQVASATWLLQSLLLNRGNLLEAVIALSVSISLSTLC